MKSYLVPIAILYCITTSSAQEASHAASGTGLDVIPPSRKYRHPNGGKNTFSMEELSLKYTNKSLSARLFLAPGKNAGDRVSFSNPYLTPSGVRKPE